MSDFLRRIRLPLLFAALVIATVLLMLGGRRAARGGELPWSAHALLEAAAPLQKAITRPFELAAGVWRDYLALIGVRAENEELRARIAELEDQNSQFREALVASGHLQRIVEMRKHFEVPLLPTEVVGQDVSPWFRSLLLDRGRDANVRSGMPVVSDQGLVGLVSATTPHASRAMLLLDRRSAADVVIQRSRARGIVRGTGTPMLQYTFMVRGDDVIVGDEVVTSGIGGVYPKGLRVGTVRSVQREPGQTIHTAEVVPAVDFGRVEQVFVMLHRSPTLDLLFATDGDAHGAEVASQP
jgi:rod shape-determining protein MreC